MAREDNREDAPRRLFGVADQQPQERPGLDEHQVTELLGRAMGDHATRVRPSGGDLAGVAIKRARRVQRRRRVTGLAAVVLATVSVTGALLVGLSEGGGQERGDGSGSIAGLFSDDDRDDPAPVDPPTEPPREVELAADAAVVEQVSGGLIAESDADGLVLATGDGRLADLNPISDVNSVHRVAGGWVVVTSDTNASRLWWVTGGGEPQLVLSGMDSIVAEGTRVSWRLGSQLSAGVLAPGGDLAQRVELAAPPGDVAATGFLGDAVLLRRTTGGGAVSWAIWRPDECAANPCTGYEPDWNSQVLRIYGVEPGGDIAIGLVPAVSKDQGVCLARLRIADSLAVTERVCPPELPSSGAAGLSPDGQWLVTAAGDGAKVVDVVAAFGGDPAAVLPVAGVAAPVSRPTWSASGEAVYSTGDSLVWLHPERVRDRDDAAIEVAKLSGAPPTLIQLSR